MIAQPGEIAASVSSRTGQRMQQLRNNLRSTWRAEAKVTASLKARHLVSASLQLKELDRTLVCARQTVEMIDDAIAAESAMERKLEDSTKGDFDAV